MEELVIMLLSVLIRKFMKKERKQQEEIGVGLAIENFYYTHEDSDALSNSEEESDQDLRLLIAFEKESSEAKDTFMDALEDNDFL